MQGSQPMAILAIIEISWRPISDQLALWRILALYMALYGALTERRRSPPSGMGVLLMIFVSFQGAFIPTARNSGEN